MILDYSEYESYTDMVDASFDISLHEYGLIRNPSTGNTLFCLNPTDNYEMYEDQGFEYEYRDFDISLQDVIDALNEVDPEYFSFIGSTVAKELSTIYNSYLSGHIMSLNMYNGYFTPHD